MPELEYTKESNICQKYKGGVSMARPRKCRRVCGMPRNNSFAPMGLLDGAERVIMAVDEYETIRLIDLAGYTQEECA